MRITAVQFVFQGTGTELRFLSQSARGTRFVVSSEQVNKEALSPKAYRDRRAVAIDKRLPSAAVVGSG